MVSLNFTVSLSKEVVVLPQLSFCVKGRFGFVRKQYSDSSLYTLCTPVRVQVPVFCVFSFSAKMSPINMIKVIIPLLIVLIPTIECFSSGAPDKKDVCRTMTPGHTAGPQTRRAPYKIIVDKDTYGLKDNVLKGRCQMWVFCF